MTTTQQEGNRLIAEFMGLKIRWAEYPDPSLNRLEVDKGYWTECLYHSSWDWLMPVVEKICYIEISDQYVRIEIVPGGYVKIENLKDTPIFTNVAKEGSLIAAIWKAVVKFIQWHNKIKQP